MLRSITIFTLGLFTASILTACGSSPTVSTQLKLEPDDCSVNVNEQVPLTLSGVVPPNSLITWTSTSGNVVTTPPGINAQFIAPSTPGKVIISVSITSPGTPASQSPLSLECKVLSPLAGAAGTDPGQPPSSTYEANGSPTDIIISEVMSTPCGGQDFNKYNQYVELYNKGTQAVDVRGWWLYDPGPVGTPDSLVAWADRVPNAAPGSNVITNSTVIPAHAFAVILSPLYVNGVLPYQMPYNFPAGTIILSIKDGERLGDDYHGIVGTGPDPDILALYIGGSNSVLQVISTYGNPTQGSYPQDFHDKPGDGFPFSMPVCYSVERTGPDKPDIASNWKMVGKGSPGQAPYQP